MHVQQKLQLRPETPVQDAGFSADSQSLWTVHDELHVRRWDTETGAEQCRLDPWNSPIPSRFVSPAWDWDRRRARACVSACGRYLLALLPETEHGTVFSRVFSLESLEIITVNYGLCWFSSQPGVLTKGHGKQLAATAKIADVEPSSFSHLHDLAADQYLHELAFLPQSHRRFCLSPDRRHVASWQGWQEHNTILPPRANEVSVWDIADQSRTSRFEFEQNRPLAGHQDAIFDALFLVGEDPRLVTTSRKESWGSASDEHNALVWDFASAEPLFALEGLCRSAVHVKSTPCGKMLLTLSAHDTIREAFVRVFDAASGRALFQTASHRTQQLPPYACGVDAMAVSADSRYLATLCSNTGRVHVTALDDATLLASYDVAVSDNETDRQALLRFSPDSSQLLVAVSHACIEVRRLAD
tara:strand:+ start:13288 stop:14529 length:1242 start_codon:yes stop_codon:yes gene_type:complete